MTIVTWARKTARSLGKVGLYGAGGVLIGMPAISFAEHVWNGNTLTDSADHALDHTLGIYDRGTKIDQVKMRDGAIRTVIGAGLIYAASKI